MKYKTPFDSYAIMWFVFALLLVFFYWSPFPYLLGYGPQMVRDIKYYSFEGAMFLILYCLAIFLPFFLVTMGVYKTKKRIQMEEGKGMVLILLTYILLSISALGMLYFFILL